MVVSHPIIIGEESEKVNAKTDQLNADSVMIHAGLDTDISIINLSATEPIPRNILIDQHGIILLTSAGYSEENLHEIASKISELIHK